MRAGYRAYLEGRCTPKAAATRHSRAKSIEDAYGDLDTLYDQDRFQGVVADLRYTMADSRALRPNPSRIRIGGDLYKRLASLRNALVTYRQFIEGGQPEAGSADEAFPLIPTGPVAPEQGSLFALERDLQRTLRDNLDQLEPGLRAIDDGFERNVPSGYIDITAEGRDGAIVVIELKAGKARRDAVGQIMSYIGDLMDEEPGIAVRGILIASGFDTGAKAAARAVNSLTLRQYRISFSFADPAVSEE